MSAGSARRTGSWTWLLALAASLVVAALATPWWLERVRSDPEVVLLRPEHGARWIRMPRAEGPETYGADGFSVAYRKRFGVDAVPRRALLHLRALNQATIYLDGRRIGATRGRANWKQLQRIDLAPFLAPGPHELFVSVTNMAGPPLLLAYSPALGLRTDATWKARDAESEGWLPAATPDTPQANSIGAKFEHADRAFLAKLPLFLPLFALVAAWSLALEARPDGLRWLRRSTPSASSVRWLLLVAWAVLGANNITRIPYFVGFDVHGHLEYIQYIVRLRTLPFAPDGWVMFQSPLYHLLSAPLYVVANALAPEKAVEALRVIPLLCGALQVQLSYLAMRLVYPERDDLQALGTVLAGLLPMNLYLSQNLGNETLVGALCSGAIVVALGLLRSPARRCSWQTLVGLGTLLGLALLTKVTALLLVPPIALLIVYASHLNRKRERHAWRASGRALALTLAAAAVVCGWYYVRNWLTLGVPFMGGWDPNRGLYVWWQEPGYRTVSQFVSFGSVLTEPVYSAVDGLWDGLYSTLWLDGFVGSQTEVALFPPWNLGLMLSSVWLSLLPTAALLIGGIASVARPSRTAPTGQLFSASCLALYLLAITYLTLRIPSFSTIKATYTMGVTVCYAVVAATGFELLMRTRPGRAIVFGGMACWGVAAYAAYFVV